MDKKVVMKELKEWSKSIMVAIIIAIPIMLFASPTYVDGRSMEKILENNDILLSERITSMRDSFKHGEIVVFDARPVENKNYIKRIIGLPNDIVEIKEGHVYVNGELLKEEYLKEETYTVGEFSIKVPEGKVFVLGDNREHSKDSREIGCVSMEKIKSRAYYRVYPFNKMGSLK